MFSSFSSSSSSSPWSSASTQLLGWCCDQPCELGSSSSEGIKRRKMGRNQLVQNHITLLLPPNQNGNGLTPTFFARTVSVGWHLRHLVRKINYQHGTPKSAFYPRLQNNKNASLKIHKEVATSYCVVAPLLRYT